MAVRCDIVGLLEEVQTILETANTITASPIDLSANLTTRINKVLKVHPERIRPQASFFPLVTMFISSKPVVTQDIANSQLQATRRSKINLSIVGSIWNTNITSVDEDPADEDVQYLMENIELALRGNPTFNAKVAWQAPTDVKYYITLMSEKTHLRSGILNYECEMFY